MIIGYVWKKATLKLRQDFIILVINLLTSYFFFILHKLKCIHRLLFLRTYCRGICYLECPLIMYSDVEWTLEKHYKILVAKHCNQSILCLSNLQQYLSSFIFSSIFLWNSVTFWWTFYFFLYIRKSKCSTVTNMLKKINRLYTHFIQNRYDQFEPQFESANNSKNKEFELSQKKFSGRGC